MLYIFYSLLVPGSITISFAQTREELKQQAEIQLRQMTPEELERKLDELGISREDAVRRARELNISLENFLTKPDALERLEPSLESETSQFYIYPHKEAPRLRREIPEVKKPVVIPGFTGRASIVDTLFPFGYDIFKYPASTYEPVLNVATPTSYSLGPGDQVGISVWGETKLNYQLSVNRDGNVVIPDVGPVVANGLTIQQFREKILRRMSSIYSGLKGGSASANTFLDVSLGKLRTIQVFVLGEVEKPGGYVLSSMSTVFHALYRAGGSTVNGTLRAIQIVRGGEALYPIDLYDYIVSGISSRDPRLQDGDVVFVKPPERRVAVQGRAVRPAIYELKEDERLGQLISLVGGLRFDAYHERIHIERVIPFDQRKLYGKDLLDIDLSMSSIEDLKRSSAVLENGDVITVFKISNLPVNRVIISGNVKKPGVFELTPGMRIRDLILRADSLDRNTFVEVGTLFRVLPNLRREIRSFNIGRALQDDAANNLPLKNEDSLIVYKESRFFPEQTVTITGGVRTPGSYRRDDNMSVSDLIVLAGGLTEDGITGGIEISRIETTSINIHSQVYKIDLPTRYWERTGENPFRLKDLDHVSVPTDPRYSKQKLVSVSGYVMFPGSYSILKDDDRLADIIARAGGVKPGAYLEASRLFRRGTDEGVIPVNFKPIIKDTLEKGKRIVNVIPVDFMTALDDQNSRDNVIMKEGDSIYIAFREDVVYVRGEVIVPSPVLYKKGASLAYYINQAGGYKEEADEDRTVVILASGKKWESAGFLFANPEILPGSSIYVPRRIEKESNVLPVIRDMATILASIAAITVALISVQR